MVRSRALGAVLVAVLLAGAPAPVRAQGEGTSAGNGNSNRPDLNVPMISRDAAEKFLPPPVKVVDLSKPGNVYKSSDPLIAAAVADYLSRIKEPHDQFGNIITKNYKSAQLPDTVDSKVIGHIVAFVKDQRFIALSPRAAQSLNAAQQIQRQKDIDRIIYEDWAAKVRRKAANFNGGGGGGNANNPGPGPTANPLPTPSGSPSPSPSPSMSPSPSPSPPANQNTNNTNGAGGGNANGNGTGGGGNENVPNLNNGNGGGNANNTNGGGGGAVTAASLSAEFNVVVVNQPQAWTADELGDLKDVLSKLPRRFYQGVEFKRAPGISPSEGAPPDPNILGVCFNSGQTAGSITLADGFNQTDRVTKQDWPNPPWTAAEGVRQHARAILAHEITHNLQFYGEGRRLSNLNESALVRDFATTFGWTFNSAESRWTFDANRRAERITQYAIGTQESPTSPMEDMAETVAFFLYDPARLRATAANNSSRFEWVKQKLAGMVEQPSDPTHTIGTPAQRGVGR